ncbi:MAG: molybdopterin-dependent oxidoreductase [Iamia sp.]
MNLPGALRDAPDAMRDKVPAALQPSPTGLPTDSPLRTDRMAAALGVALGVTFTICFLTGVLSHLIQDPPSWFLWPTRPINGYRFTQGLHVATGLATIPILLAKLWVVYPKFFRWPPATGLSDAVSRLSDLLLVGGGLFLLFSGTANLTRWRPWGFGFTSGHFWSAMLAYGALLVHVAYRAATTRRELGGGGAASLLRGDDAATSDGAAPTTDATPAEAVAASDEPHDDAAPAEHEGPPAREHALSRRGFLGAVGLASVAITVTTVGQTLPLFRRLNILGPRRPEVGPQGLPVNATAAGAGVLEAVETDAALADYRLGIVGAVDRELELTLDDLRSMPQAEEELPIACVEGWSASGRWGGVPVPDLLAMAGAPKDAEVTVISIQEPFLYASSELNRLQASDRKTLLALDLNGEPLHVDHGRPVRLIGANRPGVQQTKWVTRLEVR